MSNPLDVQQILDDDGHEKRLFREFCGAGYAGCRMMRLRSSVKLARPYIWRLTALTLLTMPSTLPELQGRVSPLRTASLSMRIPVAKERSSGWPSAASTAASQGSRCAAPVS